MNEYINEIIEMGVKDQDFRKKFIEAFKAKDGSSEKLGKEMTAMDAKHTKALKRILKEIGFPTISKVGRDCAQYAWLIVQHSPDHKFMRQYLKQMEQHLFKDVEKGWYQRLVDRLLIYDGKEQIYGTHSKL